MPKKILLADDSITIQKVVELTFSDGDYEVTAVNNGAKAIQKLADMRPDIILSDIIMPEKNGYEVCEFVKSHPEYRNIPVVLLTGTFEPFDPDRADKAGCDAVVTKPFESQSLIHKVEELIEHARSAAPTEKAPAMPAAAPPAPAPAPPPAPAAAPSPWMEEPPAAAPSAPPVHDNEIFGAPPPAEAFSGETRAFPKMNFEQTPQQFATQQIAPPSAASAPAPWDEEPPAGETRAFPKMSFDNVPAPPPSASTPEPELPFGASPSADAFSGETRAFPKLTLDKAGAPAAAPQQPAAPSPWDEPPASGGETKAFPKINFDDLDKQADASRPAETGSPWDQPSASAPAWSTPEPPAAAAPAREPEPAAAEPQAPAWAPPPAPAPEVAMPHPANGNGLDLTDEQIDRIARRVVQLMSDQVVRNIAWEVIPDLAEMVVKERIRQLETE